MDRLLRWNIAVRLLYVLVNLVKVCICGPAHKMLVIIAYASSKHMLMYLAI